jgi:hypothetical protein
MRRDQSNAERSLISVREVRHMHGNDADSNHQQARKEKMLGT